MVSESVRFCDVADQAIIEFRESENITSYIPFHFYAPTPFAHAVLKTHRNVAFAYLAVNRTYARQHGFQIIPMHPLSSAMRQQLQVLSFDEGMSAIRWDVMDERDYNDSVSKCICMAECVTDQPLNILSLMCQGNALIFVPDDNRKKMVFDHMGQAFDFMRQSNPKFAISANITEMLYNHIWLNESFFKI